MVITHLTLISLALFIGIGKIVNERIDDVDVDMLN